MSDKWSSEVSIEAEKIQVGHYGTQRTIAEELLGQGWRENCLNNSNLLFSLAFPFALFLVLKFLDLKMRKGESYFPFRTCRLHLLFFYWFSPLNPDSWSLPWSGSLGTWNGHIQWTLFSPDCLVMKRCGYSFVEMLFYLPDNLGLEEETFTL